jgi:MSHA pilin protein MshA
MKQVQRGFTLIELVMVIVILGVLAAVAIPKFVDLGDEAKAAAVKGIAGAAGSASAINYAGCSVVGNTVTANKCVRVRACADVATILQGDAAGNPEVAAASGGPSTGIGLPATCTVTKDTKTADFVVIGAGN